MGGLKVYGVEVTHGQKTGHIHLVHRYIFIGPCGFFSIYYYFPCLYQEISNKIQFQWVNECFLVDLASLSWHSHMRKSLGIVSHCPLSAHLHHQLCLLGPCTSHEFESPDLEEWVEFLYLRQCSSDYISLTKRWLSIEQQQTSLCALSKWLNHPWASISSC